MKKGSWTQNGLTKKEMNEDVIEYIKKTRWNG